MRSLAACALLLAACHAKLEGTLLVDGEPFAVTECRSGMAFGFSGIQLMDAAGRRVRVIANPADGSAKAALFGAGESRGVDLGSCGSLELVAQSSTVNGVKNQRGEARLGCADATHHVAGTLRFENCH